MEGWLNQAVAPAVSAAVRSPEVTILLPAYNEELAIQFVLEEIVQAMSGEATAFEILVVDDASTDDTAALAEQFARSCRPCPVRVIRCPVRRGAGAARKIGIREARGEIVVMLDADGSYSPESIPELLRFFPDYDQVNGARTSEQGTHAWLRRPVKWLLRMLANRLSGHRIPDLNTGLKAFKRAEMLRFLWVVPDGFSCVTTMTLAFLTNGRVVKYVPTPYRPRIGRSKFHPVRDTLAYLNTVLRLILYFRPLRIFLPLAGLAAGRLGIATGICRLAAAGRVQGARGGPSGNRLHDLHDRAAGRGGRCSPPPLRGRPVKHGDSFATNVNGMQPSGWHAVTIAASGRHVSLRTEHADPRLRRVTACHPTPRHATPRSGPATWRPPWPTSRGCWGPSIATPTGRPSAASIAISGTTARHVSPRRCSRKGCSLWRWSLRSRCRATAGTASPACGSWLWPPCDSPQKLPSGRLLRRLLPLRAGVGGCGFSLHAAARTYQLLKLDDPPLAAWLHAGLGGSSPIKRQAGWPTTMPWPHWALWHMGQITESDEFLGASRQRIDRVLSWQSHEGGLKNTAARSRAIKPSRSMPWPSIAAWRVMPGSTSRCAGRWPLPGSFSIPTAAMAALRQPRHAAFLSPRAGAARTDDPVAAELAEGFLRAPAAGKQAFFSDERMFAHRTANFIEAYLDWAAVSCRFSVFSFQLPVAGAGPDSTALSNQTPSGPCWLPEAGILVERSGDRHTIISAARGGNFTHFSPGRPSVADAGLILETADGRCAVSQMHDRNRAVEFSCLGDGSMPGACRHAGEAAGRHVRCEEQTGNCGSPARCTGHASRPLAR